MEHIKNILGNLGNSQVESKDISDDEIMRGLGIGSQGETPNPNHNPPQVSDDEILKGLGLDTASTPSPSPSVGFLGQAAAVVPGVVSGARQGLSGALKTLAYADTYDRENILKSPSLPGDDFSQAQELVRDLVPENTRPLADHPLWKHAQKSDAREQKDYPVKPGTELTHSISQGLGQVGMMAGTGAVPLVGTPLAMLQGMGLSQGEALDDATKHKADIEQLRQAGQAGAISGMLEYALPFKLLRGFNRIKQGFGKEFLSLIGSGSTEAIQEALQQLTLNYAAKDIGYDEKRELFAGLKEAAGVGGAVGIIAHLAARSLGIKLDVPDVPKADSETTPVVEETPEVDTPELAQQDAALVAGEDQEVPITNEQRQEFFQLADKYKGYENIPDDHPIYEEMDEEVVLKLAQEYDAKKPRVQAKEPKVQAKRSVTKEEVDLKDSINAVEERIEQKTEVLNNERNEEVRDEDYIEKLHDSIDKETDRHKKLVEKLRIDQTAEEIPKGNKSTRYEVGLSGGDVVDITVEELPNGKLNITNNETGEVVSIAKNVAKDKDTYWLLNRALEEGQEAESFNEAGTFYVENFNEGNEEIASEEASKENTKSLNMVLKNATNEEAQVVKEPKVEESVVEEPKIESVSEEPKVETASDKPETSEQAPEVLIKDIPEEGPNVEESPSPVEPSIDTDKLESQMESFTTGQKNLIRRLVNVAKSEYQAAGYDRKEFEHDYDDSPEEFVKLAADTVFGNEEESDVKEEPTKKEATKDPAVPEFKNNDEARKEYELNPRSFPTYESAEKFAKVRGAKGAQTEVIKVSGKYRIGESKSAKQAKIEFDKIMADTRREAEADYLKQRKESLEKVLSGKSTEVEVIKAKGKFTKATNGVYLAPVDDSSGRSIAIVKRGEGDYEVLLGTPEQIQTDTAEPIGQYPSLIKAKKALGDKGKGKASKKKKVESFEALKEYLQKEVEKHKKALDKARQEELTKLIASQEADLDEELDTLDEAERLETIALDDYEAEGDYFKDRSFGDVTSDILTLITSDERGAINPDKLSPEMQKEILDAKNRLKNDVKQILGFAKRVSKQLFLYPNIAKNQDGEVAKVFHGTTSDFKDFDDNSLGKTTGARSAQLGHFFAGKPETANTYANYFQDGAVTTFEEVEKFSDVTPDDAIKDLFYDHPDLYEASEDYEAAQKNMSRLWDKVIAGEIDEENLEFRQVRKIYRDATQVFENEMAALYKLPDVKAKVDNYILLKNQEEFLNANEDFVLEAYDKILSNNPEYIKVFGKEDRAWKALMNLIEAENDDADIPDIFGGLDALDTEGFTDFGKRDISVYLPLFRTFKKANQERKVLEKRLIKEIPFDNLRDEIEGKNKRRPNVRPSYLVMKNPYIFDMENDHYRDVGYTNIIKKAWKLGHDGVILRNTKDGGPFDDVYVVKTASQIIPAFDFEAKKLMKLAEVLLNQKGYINIQQKGLAQAWKEFTRLLKKGFKSVRDTAKAMFDWAITKRPNQALTPRQRTYTAIGFKGWLKDVVSSWKLNSSQAVNEMHKDLVNKGRIVPEHDGKSRDLFTRTYPIIPENKKPILKAGIEKIGKLSFIRSPSHIFSAIYDTLSNPIIDAFESIMSLANNMHNSERWIKAVLNGVEDSSEKVQEVLNPLYAQVEGLVEARKRQLIRVKNARENYQVQQDPATRKGLWAKWKQEAKALKKLSQKIQDELVVRYDSEIPKLAQAHADVRILLQAAGQLPAGITLSQDELNRADKIREYFDTIRGELQKVGIPVKSNADFMHRVLPDLLKDRGAVSFMSSRKDLPKFLKFAHQAEEGRLWYPSAHITLNSYAALVERKLAFQPFLNRWHDARETMPREIREYFDDWLDRNLYRQPYGQLEKFANGVIAFEYMRIIGGSLSVAFKHATKAADTLAIYDSVTNVKALGLSTKAVIQRAMQALGIKGRTKEIELMKTYITAKNLVRMLDETPGMTGILNKTKMVLGSPTMMTEFFDNGISIMATTLASARSGLSYEEAHRKIWETVLNANFRGQFDQPFFYKNTAGRAIGMFQVTPSKLLEYRLEMIHKAFTGQRDIFGTLYMTRLMRYILLFGAAETIARWFGNTIIDQVTHLPFAGHLVKGTKRGYEIHEPRMAKSPLIDIIGQTASEGLYTGLKEHFLDLPTGRKFSRTVQGDYPKNYYNSPVSSLFGIYKLDSGKKATSSRNRRRPSRRNRN